MMFVLFLGSPSFAQDVPKSGEAEYDTYYLFDTRASSDSGLGMAGIDEFSGITRNVKGEGPFHDMSVHCLAHWTLIGDAFKSNGSCVETDKDGDNVFTTFDEGTHYVVGGTGKYKGITGKAPYTVTELHNTAGGRAARIVNHKAAWQIE
jgi:hypothetical protein